MPINFQLGSTEQHKLPLDKVKLVIVDGKELPRDQYVNIDHTKIQHMKVLTPEEAKTKYGEKGEAGAIIITAKK